MRQDQITIGGTYCVRIGSRLAPVTVTGSRRRPGHGGRAQTVYTAVTGDTRRQIEVTAARLRPAPGVAVPPSRSAAADAARKQRRAEERTAAAAAERTRIVMTAAEVCGWLADALADHLDQWLDRVAAEAGDGARADAEAAVLRVLADAPNAPGSHSWPEIAAIGRGRSAGGSLSTPEPVPGVGLVRVNRRRPVELPIGGNLAGLRERVGRRHVAESLLSVARSIRQAMGRHGTRRLPAPMRRGLWAATAAIHAANRETYRAVMGRDPLPSERKVEAAVAARLLDCR